MTTLRRILLRFCCALLLLVVGTWSACGQSFETEIIGSVTFRAWGAAAGDFDGDGDIDAAATGVEPGTIHWYETQVGAPSVEWISHQVSGECRLLSAADFDNDGDLDLMAAAYTENAFILLRNTGGAGAELFAPELYIQNAAGAWLSEPVDLDGDGLTDIATCEYNGNRIRLYHWDDGEHVEIYSERLVDPTGFAAIDYDGDGDEDLLAGSSSGFDGGIYLLEQVGALEFELRPLITNQSQRIASVAAADLDLDGDIDVIGSDFLSDEVLWWERDGDTLTPHVLPGWTSNPRDVEVADFEQDGLIDIIATSTGNGSNLRWWHNLGNGQFVDAALMSGDQPYDATIIDFDRDGDPDIVASHFYTGEVVLYRNLLGAASLIEGRVTSLATGDPAEHVLMSVVETGSSTYTDSDGMYLLAVAPGTHTVRATHVCYTDTVLFGVVTDEDETVVQNLGLRRPLVEVSLSSLNVIAQNEQERFFPLVVTNTGDGPLAMTSSVEGNGVAEEWLSIDPAAAVLEPLEELVFTIRIAPDTSNAQAWDYAGVVALRTNACPDSTMRIPVLAHVLDAKDQPALPAEISVGAAYPNPFNSATMLEYTLPKAQRISIQLYDVQGRIARRLLDARQEAGIHTMEIDAAELAAGVYFVRLTAQEFTHTQKLLFLK